MNKIFLLFGLLFFGAITAQNQDQEIILKDARESAVFLEEKDPSFYITKIHPGILKELGKEKIVESFKSLAEGTDQYKVNVMPGAPDQITVSEIIEKNNSRYAFVIMPVEMEMTFFKKIDSKFKNDLIQSFAAQKITPNFKSDDTVFFSKNSMLIAVNNRETLGEWRYLNYDPDSDLVKKIVGKEIVDQATEILGKDDLAPAPVKKEATPAKTKAVKKK